MDQLGINGWQLAVQMVAFIIFVFLLWRFALKPIVGVLDQRQARISESMSAAERMQQELKETQARNEEVLQQARREAQDVLVTARQNAEQIEARAREKADAAANEFLTRAQETLRQETAQARQALRQEVGDLAVTAAGRILRKEIDPDAQRSIIESTLAEASGPNQA
ncbi:MAG TPA: F0F1 ATP synthase subunit B [Thermomicrobiales bacterium]|nr:F0F1 ATP synthase subunit B [Thermomicrobiales bacterium]